MTTCHGVSSRAYLGPSIRGPMGGRNQNVNRISHPLRHPEPIPKQKLQTSVGPRDLPKSVHFAPSQTPIGPCDLLESASAYTHVPSTNTHEAAERSPIFSVRSSFCVDSVIFGVDAFCNRICIIYHVIPNPTQLTHPPTYQIVASHDSRGSLTGIKNDSSDMALETPGRNAVTQMLPSWSSPQGRQWKGGSTQMLPPSAQSTASSRGLDSLRESRRIWGGVMDTLCGSPYNRGQGISRR